MRVGLGPSFGRRHSAVVNADDVIAEPRFDEFAGGLALLQRERGRFKNGVHYTLAEPAQIASAGLTAGIVAEFAGEFLEVFALLHAFEQFLGYFFLLIRVGSRRSEE